MTNWEEMAHVWDHTFRERLRIDPRECQILLTGAHAFASCAHAVRCCLLTAARGGAQTRR